MERLFNIESQVPVEVILRHLKYCVVLNGWSLVLITENKKCNYYFNFDIYKHLNNLKLKQLFIFPLNHIKMIKEGQDMKFPNTEML